MESDLDLLKWLCQRAKRHGEVYFVDLDDLRTESGYPGTSDDLQATIDRLREADALECIEEVVWDDLPPGIKLKDPSSCLLYWLRVAGPVHFCDYAVLRNLTGIERCKAAIDALVEDDQAVLSVTEVSHESHYYVLELARVPAHAR